MASFDPLFFLHRRKFTDADSRLGTSRTPPLKPFEILVFAAFLVSMAGFPRAAYGLNPMYHYTVIAEDGQALATGETISTIEPYVSVNESGHVAFIAKIDTGDQLLVGWNEIDPFNVSQSPTERNFDFPQINNQNRIVTRELRSGNSLIRVWNLNNPAAFTLIASTTLSAFSQVTIPTIGNTKEPADQYLVGFWEEKAICPSTTGPMIRVGGTNRTGWPICRERPWPVSGPIQPTPKNGPSWPNIRAQR